MKIKLKEKEFKKETSKETSKIAIYMTLNTDFIVFCWSVIAPGYMKLLYIGVYIRQLIEYSCNFGNSAKKS